MIMSVFSLRVCVLLPLSGSEMAKWVKRLTADQRVQVLNPTHAVRLVPRLTQALKGYLAIDSERYLFFILSSFLYFFSPHYLNSPGVV